MISASMARRKSITSKKFKEAEAAKQSDCVALETEGLKAVLAQHMVTKLGAAVRQAADKGDTYASNWWDTDTKYGGRQSEEVLQEAYNRAEIVLARAGYCPKLRINRDHDGDSGHRVSFIVSVTW